MPDDSGGGGGVAPTHIDYKRAVEYAFHRNEIIFFNQAMQKYPHLAETWIIKIWPHNELIKYNAALADTAIYVELHASELFCKKSFCRANFPRGQTCSSSNEKLEIFNSGDTILTACQQMCFYQTLDGKPQDNHTLWSSRLNTCLLCNSLPDKLAFDDYTRTNIHPTPHVDTIGTGFDRDTKNYIDGDGNETFHYKLNNHYCSDYLQSLSSAGDTCTGTWFEKITGFLIGDYIYLLSKYLATKKFKGETFSTVNHPNVVKPTPEQIASLKKENLNFFTSNFKKFLNPTLTLTDLGFTADTMYTHYFTNSRSKYGELVSIFPLLPSLLGNKVPNSLRIDPKTGQRYIHPAKVLEFEARLKYNVGLGEHNWSEFNQDFEAAIEQYKESLKSFLKTTLEISENVVLGLLIDKIVYSVLKNVQSSLAQSLNRNALRLTHKYAFRYLLTVSTKALVGAAIKRALLSAVTRLLALSETGPFIIFTLLTSLVDVIISVFDPLGLFSAMDQKGVDFYSIFDIALNKNLYGTGTVEYSPYRFVSMYEMYEMTKVPPNDTAAIFESLKNEVSKQSHFLIYDTPPFDAVFVNKTTTPPTTPPPSPPPPTTTRPVFTDEDMAHFESPSALQFYFVSAYMNALTQNSNGETIDKAPLNTEDDTLTSDEMIIHLNIDSYINKHLNHLKSYKLDYKQFSKELQLLLKDNYKFKKHTAGWWLGAAITPVIFILFGDGLLFFIYLLSFLILYNIFITFDPRSTEPPFRVVNRINLFK
ncbi:per os infectivity factor p74 [Cotesia congregata filamentous virus 1]|uniref:Per os infectivity factor p74 n=1 Tax=Cotesia congregata filamentous virus 1 TaxID=3064291 RepID=A0ABC8QJK3_9VIRU|nr:per os infectivity factor p74 [Cotesia congregata filamentous virus 1]